MHTSLATILSIHQFYFYPRGAYIGRQSITGRMLFRLNLVLGYLLGKIRLGTRVDRGFMLVMCMMKLSLSLD